MDPFTEKQLIEALQLISGTLMGIKAELADLNVAVREMNELKFEEALSEDEDSEDEEEAEEDNKKENSEDKEKIEIEDADEGFVVAEEDTIVSDFKDNSEEAEDNSGDNF